MILNPLTDKVRSISPLILQPSVHLDLVHPNICLFGEVEFDEAHCKVVVLDGDFLGGAVVVGKLDVIAAIV